jgi:hypothetical protein
VKVLFKDDLIVVQNQNTCDEVSLQIVVKRILVAMEGVPDGEISTRFRQWVNLACPSDPIAAETEFVHVVEVIEALRLVPVTILVQQKFGRIHPVDVDFLRSLRHGDSLQAKDCGQYEARCLTPHGSFRFHSESPLDLDNGISVVLNVDRFIIRPCEHAAIDSLRHRWNYSKITVKYVISSHRR